MVERQRIDAQNPWPWLDPFTESAASFFAGRDEDAQALLRGVQATPACVLFGKSGLGKTSLLLAGLFPLLRARMLLPVFLRAEHREGAAGLSSQLRRALDDAVARAQLQWTATSADPVGDGDDLAGLWERLHDRRYQLLDASGRRWTIVFVLDQFEEIFTLEPDERRRRQSFQQLGDLIENRVPPGVTVRLDRHEELLDHIDQDSQTYRFLLSLREDFLPELEAWADLIPRLGPNRYRLLPMSHEQALEAVQRTGGKLVDPDAAARIVEFLGRQSAQVTASVGRVVRESRRIEPALLSLVCSSLNADRLAQNPPAERLDVTDLETRGARILDRFYDEAFAGLSEAERAQGTRWVESDLITAGGTRRPYPVGAVEEALKPVLRQLVDRRLLRIENTEQGDQVELVHDRLAVVALQRAQAAQQRADVAERLRRDKEAAEIELLKQRARAWRRAKWLIACLVIVAVAAVLQWRAALQAKEVAETAREAAETQAARAAQAAKSSEACLAATQKFEEAAQVLAGTASGRVSEATTLLSDASRVYQAAKQDVAQLQTCPDGRRIYPQVGSEADAAALAPFTQALRAAGFVVPRAEILPPRKMPAATEVRYFRESEKSGAVDAKEALTGLPGVAVKYIPGNETSTAIRPCHYELWIAPGAMRH